MLSVQSPVSVMSLYASSVKLDFRLKLHLMFIVSLKTVQQPQHGSTEHSVLLSLSSLIGLSVCTTWMYTCITFSFASSHLFLFVYAKHKNELPQNEIIHHTVGLFCFFFIVPGLSVFMSLVYDMTLSFLSIS